MGIHHWTDSPHSVAVFNIVYIWILNTLLINQSTCGDMWRNQMMFLQKDVELQTNVVPSFAMKLVGNHMHYAFKPDFGRWCMIKSGRHFWDY